MTSATFITNLRGAKKIRTLKKLSQIDFPKQPVLICEDLLSSKNGSEFHRSILRIREVYLDNRDVIIALDQPMSLIINACQRFGIKKFAILDGDLDTSEILTRVTNHYGFMPTSRQLQKKA